MHAINKLVILYNQLDNDDFYKPAVHEILRNLELVPELSTYDLAERCFVSPATILRLSKRLGYKSYADFKLSIGMDLNEVRTNILFSFEEIQWKKDFLAQGAAAVIDTMEQLQKDVSEQDIVRAAKYFQEVKNIVFFTSTGSAFLRNLQMRLLISGKDVSVAKTLEEQRNCVEDIHTHTVIVFIEMRFTQDREIQKLLCQGQEKGAKIIIITNTFSRNYMENSDLYIGFDGSSFRRDGLGLETVLASIGVAYSNLSAISAYENKK